MDGGDNVQRSSDLVDRREDLAAPYYDVHSIHVWDTLEVTDDGVFLHEFCQ